MENRTEKVLLLNLNQALLLQVAVDKRRQEEEEMVAQEDQILLRTTVGQMTSSKKTVIRMLFFQFLFCHGHEYVVVYQSTRLHTP